MGTNIYELISVIGKAVASPQRLEILAILRQSPRTVELLSKHANMSVANTSQHLKVLLNANLVEREKKGLFVNYRLAGEEVSSFYHMLISLAKLKNAEFDRWISKYIDNEFVFKMENAKILLDRLMNNEVLLIDVRPKEEYASSHIQGAISIPLDELNDQLKNLTKDLDIVVYCRGPYCMLSVDAVKILRAEGFNAIKMDQGIPEWQLKGLPIEISTH